MITNTAPDCSVASSYRSARPVNIRFARGSLEARGRFGYVSRLTGNGTRLKVPYAVEPQVAHLMCSIPQLPSAQVKVKEDGRA